MIDKEEKVTAQRYQQLFNEHGISHKTLDWGSQEGQHLRFKILSEIGNLNGKSILDVGCGLGDFHGWLVDHNIKADYTGIDLTPALVEQARKSHPGLTFIQGSILDESVLVRRQFDFVFASGIFATYKVGANSWQEGAVARMWNLATEGVAFNTLSSWASDQDADEYYAEPGEVLNACRKLTRWVVLRHDYHPRDFTVYLLKEQRQ